MPVPENFGKLLPLQKKNIHHRIVLNLNEVKKKPKSHRNKWKILDVNLKSISKMMLSEW